MKAKYDDMMGNFNFYPSNENDDLFYKALDVVIEYQSTNDKEFIYLPIVPYIKIYDRLKVHLYERGYAVYTSYHDVLCQEVITIRWR